MGYPSIFKKKEIEYINTPILFENTSHNGGNMEKELSKLIVLEVRQVRHEVSKKILFKEAIELAKTAVEAVRGSGGFPARAPTGYIGFV